LNVRSAFSYDRYVDEMMNQFSQPPVSEPQRDDDGETPGDRIRSKVHFLSREEDDDDTESTAVRRNTNSKKKQSRATKSKGWAAAYDVNGHEGEVVPVDFVSGQELPPSGEQGPATAAAATARHHRTTSSARVTETFCGGPSRKTKAAAPSSSAVRFGRFSGRGDGDASSGSNPGRKARDRDRDATICSTQNPEMAPLYKLSTSLSDGEKRMNRKRLRNLLQSYGEFPEKYRLLVWKFLLQLPGKHDAYRGLLARGVHEAWENMALHYPIKDARLLRKLQMLLSALTWWSPVFGEVPWIPAMVFPFCKLFAADDLGAFETVRCHAFPFFNFLQLPFLFSTPVPSVPFLPSTSLGFFLRLSFLFSAEPSLPRSRCHANSESIPTTITPTTTTNTTITTTTITIVPPPSLSFRRRTQGLRRHSDPPPPPPPFLPSRSAAVRKGSPPHSDPPSSPPPSLPSLSFPPPRPKVLAVILHWSPMWLETFPHPPVTLLNSIELLVEHHDPRLLEYLMHKGVTSQFYGWSLLRTLFTEVLSREHWLQLLDHLFTNANDPCLLPLAVVAFLRYWNHFLTD
jgi:hypothetical protein